MLSAFLGKHIRSQYDKYVRQFCRLFIGILSLLDYWRPKCSEHTTPIHVVSTIGLLPACPCVFTYAGTLCRVEAFRSVVYTSTPPCKHCRILTSLLGLLYLVSKLFNIMTLGTTVNIKCVYNTTEFTACGWFWLIQFKLRAYFRPTSHDVCLRTHSKPTHRWHRTVDLPLTRWSRIMQ